MESLDTLIGKQIGGYIIEEKVGDGAFLSVFKGRHPNLPRPVAVKILNDNREEGRLTREATILAKIGNHPNIVEVYDADFRSEKKDQKQDDKPAYVVVEYCDDSLAKRLERDKKIDWKTAIKYTRDLADALEHIHKRGVIHGDIKPSNILFNNRVVKLSDFNTKDYDPKMLANSLLVSKHADFWEMGNQKFRTATALYLSPEHTNRDGELLSQSDIHQLGQVLYEMSTGQRFIHRTESASEHGAPKWLDDVISKATENDPKRRYASGAKMRDAIQEGLDGKLDGPSSGSRFKAGFGKVISGIGNGALKGLKYAALGITAPVWGPIKLVNYFDDEGNDPGAILSLLGTIFYFGAGIPIAINYEVENKFEERTKVVARQQFEQADENLHLA